jgi:AcrR family transcriptional regulator
MMATVTGSRPGRHRSEALDQAILASALEELAAEGYSGLTMAAVIARSGVSSATLYRRWPTKQQLVAAALASMHQEVLDVDTGSLEGDLLALVTIFADSMSVQSDDLAEDVIAELRRNPEFRAAINDKFYRPRVALLDLVLARARARAELGPGLSAEVAMAFLGGPLYHRVSVTGEPASKAFVRAVAQGAAGALRALAPVAPGD